MGLWWDSEISMYYAEIVNHTCRILNALPALQTINLRALRLNLALNKKLLTLTNSHHSLLQLSIQGIAIGRRVYLTALPSSGSYRKVVIKGVEIAWDDDEHVRTPADERAEVFQKIFDLGIRIETVHIFSPARMCQIKQGFFSQWMRTKFNGLTRFTSSNVFAIEGDDAIQYFFLQHPLLVQLEITIRGSEKSLQWIRASPFLTRILEASDHIWHFGDSRNSLGVTLVRESAARPFRLAGTSLTFPWDLPREGPNVLPRIDQAYPNLQALSISVLPLSICDISVIIEDPVRSKLSVHFCYFSHQSCMVELQFQCRVSAGPVQESLKAQDNVVSQSFFC